MKFSDLINAQIHTTKCNWKIPINSSLDHAEGGETSWKYEFKWKYSLAKKRKQMRICGKPRCQIGRVRVRTADELKRETVAIPIIFLKVVKEKCGPPLRFESAECHHELFKLILYYDDRRVSVRSYFYYVPKRMSDFLPNPPHLSWSKKFPGTPFWRTISGLSVWKAPKNLIGMRFTAIYMF